MKSIVENRIKANLLASFETMSLSKRIVVLKGEGFFLDPKDNSLGVTNKRGFPGVEYLQKGHLLYNLDDLKVEVEGTEIKAKIPFLIDYEIEEVQKLKSQIEKLKKEIGSEPTVKISGYNVGSAEVQLSKEMEKTLVYETPGEDIKNHLKWSHNNLVEEYFSCLVEIVKLETLLKVIPDSKIQISVNQATALNL